MMLIDYPHSKSTHNLKVVKFKNLLTKILKFQKSFTTCKWGVMYMTSKTKLQFMKQQNKTLDNQHVFIQFEIKIIFQNKTQKR